MKLINGNFIVFEGIDGSGKTTQKNLLLQKMNSLGLSCHDTCEPTASAMGKLIRQILKGEIKGDNRVIAPLFVADRLEHILNEEDGLRKTLEKGVNVICDRYYFSSYAYQSVDVGMEKVIELNSICADYLRPSVTVFIDVSVDEALKRIKKRNEKIEIFETREMLTAVRQRYFDAFKRLENEEKILIINGDKSASEIAEEVFCKIQDFII